jgi:adenine phosphoribosyltransferase
MSALPDFSTSDQLSQQQPSHGLPTEESATKQPSNTESTSDHPPREKPDPTTAQSQPHSQPSTATEQNASQGAVTSTAPSSASELSSLKVKLHAGLRQFPDFPSPGILFEDIMPLFSSHSLHSDLIRAIELQIANAFNTGTGEQSDVDVIVGLESRGFLFGPTLALRMGAGFVPVRKKGKLPGPCETESFEKEYGADHFQMQSDAFTKGKKVIIVDDIIATGKLRQVNRAIGLRLIYCAIHRWQCACSRQSRPQTRW